MVKYRKSLSSAHGADVVDAASPAASSDQLVTEGDERQSVAAAMAAINARLQVIDEARRAGALHEADAEGAPSSSVGSGGSVDGTDHPVMGSLAALLRESQHQLGRASDSEAARGKVVEDIPVSPVHTDDGRNPVLGGRVKAFEVAAVLNLPMVKKGRDSSITMAINDMMLRRNPFNLDSSSRATLPQGESFDSVRSCPQPHVVSSDEGGPSLAVRTLVAAAAAAAAGSHSPPADTLVRTAAATGQQPSFGMSVTRQTTRPVLPNTKYLVDRKRSLSAAAARNQRKDAPKRKSSRIDTSSFIDQMSGARPGNGTMRELIDHIAASDDEEEDGGSSTISNADENEDEDEDDTVVKMLGEK